MSSHPKPNGACYSCAPPSRQLTLLDVAPSFVIASNAHARNAYGTVAQHLACAALGMSPVPINGNYAVCFDADRAGTPYEIKSVHRSGKLVIYDWRAEKENAFPALRYALVVHRTRGCRSATALLATLHRYLEIWDLPAAAIHNAALQCPLRRLVHSSPDARNGYSRDGYARGYRNVPLASFHPAHSQLITFTCYAQIWHATLRS